MDSPSRPPLVDDEISYSDLNPARRHPWHSSGSLTMQPIDPDELAQVVQALERSKRLLDELVVRGLRMADPGQLDELEALRSELSRVGAHHLAQRMEQLVAAMRNDDPESGRALLRAQTSLHLFDRILTMEVVVEQLSAAAQEAST